VVILSLLPGCRNVKDASDESIADIQKREGIPVRCIKVKVGNLMSCEVLGGTAEGYTQTTLTAGISGKITAINYRVGDIVPVNSSIMTIEPDGPQNFNLVKQQFETTQKSRDRLRALAEQGGVSQEMIDQVEAAYSSAKDGLDAIRKTQFLPAPFSGTIVNIYQTVNNKISSGANLCTIADMERIRIPLVVSDVIVNKFKKGQIAIAVVGNDSLKGSVENVSLSGRDNTHTFIVETVFRNTEKVLKPSMYIPVTVITETKLNTIAVPFDMLRIDGEETFVYLEIAGIARKRNLQTGLRSGDLIEIVNGLHNDDNIIINGGGMLADGVKVKVIN